jgi:hypothetical protein
MNASTRTAAQPAAQVPHIIKGQLHSGADVAFTGPGGVPFTAPALDLANLTWSRQEEGPAFNTPIGEIIDLLVATGECLATDPDGLLEEAYARMLAVSPLERGVLKRAYDDLPRLFDRTVLNFVVEGEIGGTDVLDGWREVRLPTGRTARFRAFPARLVQILAGNAPGVAGISVIRGALSKGVNLLKLPSNDLFTATAVLRAMAAVDPTHPVVKSFSAVYWRGGDAKVERLLFSPQFFDKLVAWGGEAALRSAKDYIGPGFELVAFDPKTSISMIGVEAFASEEITAEVAALAATDATGYNQSACTSSRYQYVEGSLEQIDHYCELLQAELGVERHTASVIGTPVPPDLREEIEALRSLAPEFRVWGDFTGRGLVVRSEEPVDFYPDGKIVNVVPVPSLREAVGFANVATQTVGVYPPTRKRELRNHLASAGAQRVVSLGQAMAESAGLPHDGFMPLHRMVRWVNDED